jgi:hypothetical protein
LAKKKRDELLGIKERRECNGDHLLEHALEEFQRLRLCISGNSHQAAEIMAEPQIHISTPDIRNNGGFDGNLKIASGRGKQERSKSKSSRLREWNSKSLVVNIARNKFHIKSFTEERSSGCANEVDVRNGIFSNFRIRLRRLKILNKFDCIKVNGSCSKLHQSISKIEIPGGSPQRNRTVVVEIANEPASGVKCRFGGVFHCLDEIKESDEKFDRSILKIQLSESLQRQCVFFFPVRGVRQ